MNQSISARQVQGIVARKAVFFLGDRHLNQGFV